MSSIDGRMQRSRYTAAFSLLKSVQNLAPPEFFCMGTLGAHQSVGSLIFSVIPIFLKQVSSSFTFQTSGMGTLLAVAVWLGILRELYLHGLALDGLLVKVPKHWLIYSVHPRDESHSCCCLSTR